MSIRDFLKKLPSINFWTILYFGGNCATFEASEDQTTVIEEEKRWMSGAWKHEQDEWGNVYGMIDMQRKKGMKAGGKFTRGSRKMFPGN